jgi:NADP-dependent 3-hydroxy acid dehydrogenase YdfG
MKPLAIITGVGPGTGAAMARRFSAGGYQVAMIARNTERLDALSRDLADSLPSPATSPIRTASSRR